MGDKKRFPASLREAIYNYHLDHADGREIVRICQLILLENYSEEEYDEDFFSTFNVILDDHRDGVSYNAIDRVYKDSFLNAIERFIKYFFV